MDPATPRDAVCEVCQSALAPWCEKLGRRIWRCGECGHLSVPDGLSIGADGKSIYETEDPIFHRNGNEEYYLDDTNMRAAEAKVQFVRQYWTGAGSLLDVGASFGHFLKAVSGGCDAWGCELSPAAVAWSREHFGVRNQVGSVYVLPPELQGPFQAITCWDVLEHLEHPRQALAEVRRHLDVGGWLFLSTPDAGSTIARVLGRRWHYLDPIQHLNLFSGRNLQRLLEQTGFRVAGQVHLGHRYRINYIINRLGFLGGDTMASGIIRRVGAALPEGVKRRQVKVQLGDVIALAARRTV